MLKILPFSKALLIASISSIIYLIIVFNTSSLNVGYGGFVLAIITPVVFAFIIGLCYLMLFLEKIKIIAPHFIFRFLLPFLFVTFLIWVNGNIGEDPIMDAFQQYSISDYLYYVGEFMTDMLISFGTLFFVVAGLLSLFENTDPLKSESLKH